MSKDVERLKSCALLVGAQIVITVPVKNKTKICHII